MKFHGTITARRYTERFTSEPTVVFADFFTAKSIQSAKATLTKMANGQTLFAYTQTWDNTPREYTGKDLRWRPWKSRTPYTQDDGQRIHWCAKSSERVTGEPLPNETGELRYTRYAGYTVDIVLKWVQASDAERKKQ